MKKHPVLYGLTLVFLLGTGLLIILYGFSIWKGDRPAFSNSNKIAIVTIGGIISSSQDIVDKLDDFGKDESIKAVVLRIDSPGGGVASSQEIYTAIKKLKKNKKVIASLGSIAASGGYMIACAADKIFANPGTITGSISAIMYFANAEELLKKIGLKSSVIKSGKYKDMGSPTREMTEEEKIILQGLIDDIYDQFVEVIVQDRKIPKEEVKNIADGRVFSGKQAKALRLIDELGDRSDAVNLAAKMAGIKGTPVLVYPRKKEITFWDYLLQSSAAYLAGAVQEKFGAAPPGGVSYLFEYGK